MPHDPIGNDAPTTATQPSAPSPSGSARRRPARLSRALPAFAVACSAVVLGGVLVGYGGFRGNAESPAARAGLLVSAHSRAAERSASNGPAAAPAATAGTATPATADTARPASAPPSRANGDSASRATRELPSHEPALRRGEGPDPRLDLDAPLRIKRLVVAHDVAQREPVDPSTQFKAADADRIFAFVEVENPERAESEIVVTFEPATGDPTGHVRLRVGASPRWRTWAFTRAAKAPGEWEAVVRNASGEVLARAPFSIES